MNNIRRLFRSYLWVGAGLAMLAFAFIFATVSYQPVTAAGDQKLVTFHDNNTEDEQTVVTKAKTVRDALKRASIAVGDHDAVEPAIDSELKGGVYHINIYRARPITVVDGAMRSNIVSPYQSPRQIAESAGITAYPEDRLKITPIRDIVAANAMGAEMTIDRATSFTFVLYGKSDTARSQATTVGQMLSEKGVKLGPQDGTNIALDAPLTQGMNVSVWRNGVQTVTQEESVSFPTRKITDTAQPIGYKQVQTAGVNGKKLVTYQINMQNGIEVSRQIIQQVETAPATEEVTVVGGKMTNTFSGSFAEALARLRSCEAGGVYSRNSGNGYYGAYQYDVSTWANYGGFVYASDAPATAQDEKAWQTYQRRGWAPWPSCTVKMGLQDIYR